MRMKERFLEYISIDTVSSETSSTYPSTYSQVEFGKKMVEDLKAIGIKNAFQDEFGLVYGRIEIGKKETIGLIAHMDTAPTIAGGIKNPRVIPCYDGSDIKLNEKYTMKVSEFPCLKEVIGDEIIVTDGEHLLGGDDKAGIVIIYEICKYFLAHKEEFNYNLAICFTPDEEVGAGWKHFDVKKMNATYAFTIDGGTIYEANHENFNASSAEIEVFGIGTHPGSAKNVMENAIAILNEIHSLLPKDMVPEKTEEREGFIYLCSMSGDVEHAKSEYILRDHNKKLLEKQKEYLSEAVLKIGKEHPKAKISINIKDDYYNMFDYFLSHPEAINLINKAYLKKKTRIKHTPIRGGTDGAMITFLGLPCPNLGSADFNPHGRYEFVSYSQMEKMVEIILAMLRG